MRRAPFLVAAAAVVAAGCGPGEQKSGAEIEYNCPANAVEIQTLQKETAQFAAVSGIRIRLNPFSGQDKLYAMMAAGKAPDIFYTSSTMRDQLAAEGRLLDLRTVSGGDSILSRLWPHVIENGISADSGWYSLGNWEFTCGVYYRKDLFAAAGLRMPDTAWTWDAMVADARALTLPRTPGGTGGRYGIFIASHFVETLELMNGARFSRESPLLTIPPASADIYRRYIGLIRDGLMPDILRVQALGMQPAQLLEHGRVAMLVEAVPDASLFDAMTAPWGVAPIPRFPGKDRAYFRSASGGLSISASTKNPRAAWEALKWIVTRASTYQPTPVLKDVDFAGGWERRYPQLAGSGFREVWELSRRYPGGDPRYFVRFSSWTSGLILGRLQPLLDQLWAQTLSVDSLVSAVPGINADVARELEEISRTRNLSPPFRRKIEQALREVHAPPV